ncbi:unnamed protein product [Amoebophrya sp. A120]|nr:unnamed protein product [Amoebophrya sp. A120]|eukprot:GSA120T00024517001.1
MRALLKKLLLPVILAMLHEQVPGVCATTPITFIASGILFGLPPERREQTFDYETATMREVHLWITGEIEQQCNWVLRRCNKVFLRVTIRGLPFLFDPYTSGANAESLGPRNRITDLSLTIKQHMERDMRLEPVVKNFNRGRNLPPLIVNLEEPHGGSLM